MQHNASSRIRYALDEWPPLGKAFLFGVQWAAIAVPSIIILGYVIGSLDFAEPIAQTPYLQKLFLLSGVTTLVQVLWGHRLPLIGGPATVLLIAVIASRRAPAHEIYTAMGIGGALLAVLAVTGLFAQVRKLFTDRVIATVLLLIALTLTPMILKLLIAQESGVAPLRNLEFGLALIIAMFVVHRWLPGIWKSTLIVWMMLFSSLAYLRLFPAAARPMDATAAWLSLDFLADLRVQPGLNAGVLISFLICYVALAVNDLGSIQSMNRLLELEDMDRRVIRGLTLTGICNVLAGCLGVVGPVNFSLSPGVVTASGCASRFTLVPASVLIALIGVSPAAIGLLGGVPSVVVGCVLLYILTAQIAAGLSVAAEGKVFQFEDGLVIGLPVLLGTLIAFLPADVLNGFPLLLKPILGNGFVVGTVAAFLLDRVVFRRTAERSPGT